jgi:hypothetical protein
MIQVKETKELTELEDHEAVFNWIQAMDESFNGIIKMYPLGDDLYIYTITTLFGGSATLIYDEDGDRWLTTEPNLLTILKP